MIILTLLIMASSLLIIYGASELVARGMKPWFALACGFIVEYIIIYYLVNIYIQLLRW